jgi:hypothetical protein
MQEGEAVEGVSGISAVGGGAMPMRLNPVAAPAVTPQIQTAPQPAAPGGADLKTSPLATGSAAGALAAGKPGLMTGAAGPDKTGGAMATGSAAAGSAWASNEMASLSQLSISQSSEMLMVSQAPQGAIANNELLGAVLLMLILEYMKSQDDKEKEGLLGLMGMIMQMQQQNNAQQSTLFYASNSLSIDSTQIQVASGQAATNAYTNAGLDPAAAGTSGASLNVVA